MEADIPHSQVPAPEPLDQRRLYMSFGLSLGVILVAAATHHLPDFVRQAVSTPITLAGLSAVILSLVIPEGAKADSEDVEMSPAAVPA